MNLAKVSNKLANDAITKTQFSILVSKMHTIDTTNFISKTQYEKDGSDFEDKISKIEKTIPDVTGLVKKTDFNTKFTEVQSKIPSITGLATNSALTAVENKIPDVSSLVTKTEYVIEIAKIKNDYVTTTALDTRHKDLVQKIYFDAELKKVNDKVSSNSTNVLSYEHKLKQREDTTNNLEKDASYFRGKDLFERNYLVFKPIYKYFTSDR